MLPRSATVLLLLLTPPQVCLPALSTQDLSTQTPADLVNALFGGSGLSVSNITYQGAPCAAGTFTGGAAIVGFPDGIILSTGCIASVPGPNTSDGFSGYNLQPGDATLSAAAGGSTTADAAVLQFDFVPFGNQVTFSYVFSSDEYNEYANSTYNDVFGFFLNGTNVARLPGGVTVVTINNVNGGNPYGTGANNPFYFLNNDLTDGGGSIDTEMDGLTIVLEVQAAVNPGVTNTIKMAVADVSDDAFDSNVFIKQGSFAVPTFTPTVSATYTESASVTPTRTDSPTRTATRTWTPTRTHTPTHTWSRTRSPTSSITPTVTQTASLTPSATQTPAPSGLSGVHVYPNPVKVKDGVTSLRFADLHGQAEIRIFTLAGRHVTSLKSPGGNELEWNLLNQEGRPVGSGVYIWIATNTQGGKKVGKLAVMR